MNTIRTIKKETAQGRLATPFTKDELDARIAEAKRQIAAGLTIDSEDLFSELEEEFAHEDECEIAMAV